LTVKVWLPPPSIEKISVSPFASTNGPTALVTEPAVVADAVVSKLSVAAALVFVVGSVASEQCTTRENSRSCPPLSK
jgi:hypothetical protein